ncbi:MAG: ferrochelatase [Actinobacteria bacterium]|nr:ferrochelatase [Actinomycetota bacterium]
MPRRSYGRFDDRPHDYDAVLYLSFGGPEAPEDVIPFLERVIRGRNVPRARLDEVAEHYYLFGGVSPLNAHNRAVIAALREELANRGPDLPVYWGNRNWHPLVGDTVGRMRDDGVRRAVCFITSAYSSYSSCRQYREDIARARAEVGADAPEIDPIRPFYNHPGFIEPQARKVNVALHAIPDHRRAAAHLSFTAHSIPVTMAEASDYQAQLEEACSLVAGRVGGDHPWALVWQSRSGPPEVPWLEPDIIDHLDSLHAADITDVVVVPIGFVSDHLEVRFDLDVEAAAHAASVGLHRVRADTVGADPTYVRMIRDLIVERSAAQPHRPALGARGPCHDVCGTGCCVPT